MKCFVLSAASDICPSALPLPPLSNWIIWSSHENTTKIIKSYEIQQLPYNYIIKKVKELHFRLHENATITFCIQLTNNKVSEYFFLTNEDIDNFSIKKDIVTFLSLLK